MEQIPLLHVIALSGMGGIVKMSVNSEAMTLRSCFFTLLQSCFAGCMVVELSSHKVESIDVIYGIAGIVGFVSDSLLLGIRKIATAFKDDPLQTIAKLTRKTK